MNMNPDCKRCEYMFHEYEESFCPRQDKTIRWLSSLENNDDRLLEDAISNCQSAEKVRNPISSWSKKEIIRVCKGGGASYNTIRHLENIPLEDLRNILLKPLGREPRGMHSEIWKLPPNQWEHVRNTQMYGIDWDLIDTWNQVLR